jgi:hypothetical protein
MQSQSTRKLSHDELRELHARTGIEQTVGTNEAAALTGYQPQTFRRWACEGSGPIRPRRVNGRLRWVVAELRALVNGSAPATSDAA